MSTTSDNLSTLYLFGKVRRQLNLMAVSALRPFEIGPKQAVLLREIRSQKAASLADLARLTHTDPGSTGKIIETLERRKWVKRSEDSTDRRRYLVSLTQEGIQAAQRLETVYRGIAKELCGPLSVSEKSAFVDALTKIFSSLERMLENPQEKS